MEEKFYNDDDFEKFLKEQVKHHKMFPSDKIWRNINNSLHNDYKWPALTITAFAFIALIIGVTVYFSPGPNIFAVNTPANNVKESNTTSPLTSVLSNKKNSLSKAGDDIPTLNDNTPSSVVFSDRTNSVTPEKISFNESIVEKLEENNPITSIQSEKSLLVNNNVPLISASSDLISEIDQQTKTTNEVAATDVISEKKFSEIKADLKANTLPKTKKQRAGNNKFNYQVYITPSASYRKLKEDRTTNMQQSSNVGGPVGISYVSDVNQVVKHRPGTGMEAGVTFGYEVAKHLRIKTGLQLNARQYAIDAFQSFTEVATIAFASGNGIDSLTSFSTYRTSNGHEPLELTNRYYQISIPVGLEYEVIGNKTVQLNVAASIQPTYMITKNAFLISTDFKNYIESPGMTRNWNLNANFETFISIKSGNYKWQVGPQLRYQTLPTSVKKYPIKEYLMDYGMKIGVSRNLH